MTYLNRFLENNNFMKKIVIILLAVIVLMVAGAFYESIDASTSYDKFRYHAIPSSINIDEVESMIRRINFKLVYDEYYGLSGICSFDVSNAGDVAIGFSNDIINIYDQDGNYKLSIKFFLSSAYLLEYDADNNLLLYSYRSNFIYMFNDEYLYSNIYEADYSEENQNHAFKLNNKEIISKNLYKFHMISRFPFPFNHNFIYTAIIREDHNGQRLVIYDNSLKLIFIFVVYAVLAILFIYIILKILFRRAKHFL